MLNRSLLNSISMLNRLHLTAPDDFFVEAFVPIVRKQPCIITPGKCNLSLSVHLSVTFQGVFVMLLKSQSN